MSVKNYIIDKFNLAAHYDIDTSSAKGKAKLAAKFSKLYETKKTKYDALQLSIEDVDPVMARDLVKATRERIDEVARNIIRNSQFLTLESYKNGIRSQEKVLSITGDSLTKLKDKYQIYLLKKIQTQIYLIYL